MFETIDIAEVPIPKGFAEAGERAWWYVKLRLHIQWFHLVCEYTYEDGVQSSDMLFLDQIEHLLELNSIQTIKILQADLVSPGHLNGSDRWKMEPLSEIWVGYEPEIECGQEAYIYVLENGSQYVYSALGTKEQDLLNKSKIFML